MHDERHLLAVLPLSDAFRRTDAEVGIDRLQRAGAVAVVDAVVLERDEHRGARIVAAPLVPTHLPSSAWSWLAGGLVGDDAGDVRSRFSRSFVDEVRAATPPGGSCLVAILSRVDVGSALAELRGTRLIYGALPEGVLDEMRAWDPTLHPTSLTLTVWQFPTPDAADSAERRLHALVTSGRVSIRDAALATWPTDHRSPSTRRVAGLGGAGSLGDEFWGLFFGLLLYAPLLGRACGSDADALGGALSEIGIDDAEIARLRSHITPGTSALLVLSDDALVDLPEIDELHAELTRARLSEEHELRLRDVFTPA